MTCGTGTPVDVHRITTKRPNSTASSSGWRMITGTATEKHKINNSLCKCVCDQNIVSRLHYPTPKIELLYQISYFLILRSPKTIQKGWSQSKF